MADARCQLTTRFPPELYEQMQETARKHGASLNEVVIVAVESYFYEPPITQEDLEEHYE